MSETHELHLDELIALSNRMLTAALDGDWEEVEVRQARRDRSVHAFLALGSERLARLPEAKMRMLRDLDQQLVIATVQCRDELQQELARLQRARLGARRYQENSR